MRAIPPDETLFEGLVSLERGEGWAKPWRLPFDRLRLFWPQALIERGEHATGVRLRLRTASNCLGLTVEPREEPRLFDLVIGGELIATARLDGGEGRVVCKDLPPGEKVVELWLAADLPVAVRDVLLDDGAEASVPDDTRPRWLAYGSSITQCRSAHSPARTWPATAARRRGLNLTSLGFGGQCHMDPMLARTIRDLPADVISLKLGVNMHGGSYSQRTFIPAVIGFVKTVRDGHPNIPIAVVSPIISPPREEGTGATGMNLRMMREQLAEAVRRLADCGDPNLHYFDGRILFDEDLVADYLPDQLHPSADGYEILGRNFAEKILPALGF